MYRSTKGASKARRDQINAEIRNLKELLPIAEGDKVRLSYLHIMSLACMYTRKSVFFTQDAPLEELEGLLSPQDVADFVQTLPGFLLAFTSEGKLIYISENVSDHLGHSMVDLVAQGDSIYDIIDPVDHFVMRNQMALPSALDTDRLFRCRFNTSKTVRRQSAGNKLVLIKGRFQPPPAGSYWSSNPVFIAFCIPLDPKPKATPNSSFLSFFESKHAKDMSILDISDSSVFHLGFDKRDLLCTSWYGLVHPQDVSHASAQHYRLLRDTNEARVEMVVRLQTKDQSWVWIYSLVHMDNSEMPVTCYNYVISDSEAWCLRQQLTSEETQLAYVLSSSSSAPYQESLLSPEHLPSPDQVFTPISSTPTSGVSTQSFDFSGVCNVECPPEYREGANLVQEDVQMIMGQGSISSMEEASGPSSRQEGREADFSFTDCFFFPATLEQPFRRETPGSSSKDFVCTPPYTPHQGCTFLFGSQDPYPQPTMTTTTTSTTSPSTTTATTPELYYPTENCSILYEKLPPTPDSPGDGDCTVMTVPEVRGPLFIDVPMVPEGLLTPEASPIKQTFFRYSDREKTEIDLLAQQISTLAEDFSSFAAKEMAFQEQDYGRQLQVTRSSSLPANLPSSLQDFLPIKPWRSIDFSFLMCPEVIFMEDNTVENIFQDLSPPLFEKSESGMRCSHQLGGNVSSPFSLDAETTTDLSPEEQSFLEELACYETVFETCASRSPCDGFTNELYQLESHLQDSFHDDGSEGDPSF
ncbi:neuronal PAS domain-containing protein 4 [Rhinatrema bivittatum]|uniref:neuronal PAS domain-containing protein 4 n=1 Tax=Rhinatrema bivittatum TaxID=194408 RepID=UPI0011275958|nr:neuronal PAS domain-containing protein 4 [Rhinatrema bivittatum]